MDFGNFLEIGGENFDFLGENPLSSGSRQNSLTDHPGERLWVMSTVSYITESSEILYKIDHDLTMIDRYIIFVTTPARPLLLQFFIFRVVIVHQLQAGRKMMRF